jgi:hypothetical protein
MSKLTRKEKKVQIKALPDEDKLILREVRDLKNQLGQVKRNERSLRKLTYDQESKKKTFENDISAFSSSRPDLVALADDFPAKFTTSGKSQYLRSVLAPDMGPAYIPDDVVQQCHVKAETVTYNLQVSETGSGVFLLYPDHPSSLIGYHYTISPLGVMVFDRVIRTAQTLSDNYDYARRVSQLLTIKSSSLPLGVYALNGTFNAVRVEGTLSEIPSLQLPADEFYNGLLTNTVDLYDKVGNALVGDGIAVLSLMSSVDQQFTRLGDASPVSSSGINPIVNTITDLAQSLRYHFVGTGNLGIGTGTTIGEMVMNIDSTNGIEIDLNILVSYGSPLITGYSINAYFSLLDPFGNNIPAAGESQNVFIPAAVNGIPTDVGSNVLSFHFTYSNPDAAPIAAVGISLIANYSSAPPAGSTYTITVDAMAPAAAKMGVNKAVVVVGYQGVAANSVITISGVTNFELVPNPVLRQNLALENSYADEAELEYAKNLLHNRHLVGIKSVWNLKDYWASRPILEELADVAKHEQALALSGADVVKFFKRKVVPRLIKPVVDAASAALPVAAPAFNALGKAVSNWSSSAASGVPIAARASESKTYVDYRAFAMDKSPFVAFAMDTKPNFRSKPGVIVPAAWRVVTFPTLITNVNSMVTTSGLLFAATNVKPPGFKGIVFTRSINGFSIFGLARDDIYKHNLNCDVWVFPIDAAQFLKKKVLIVEGPELLGHSGDAAIWLAANSKIKGLCPIPITGSIDSNLNVELNPAFDAKRIWLANRGLNLAGNDVTAVPQVTNVSQVINGIHVMGVKKK